MDGGSDAKVLGMNRPKNLSDILKMGSAPPAALMRPPEPAAPEPEVLAEQPLPAMDQLPPLPQPGEAYKAHARMSNGSVPTMHVVLANATVRGFSNGNFDSIDLLPPEESGGGPVIVVRYAGLSPAELHISGRNLELLHNYIGFHRIAWIRELPGQGTFIDKTAPLIRKVVIKSLVDA